MKREGLQALENLDKVDMCNSQCFETGFPSIRASNELRARLIPVGIFFPSYLLYPVSSHVEKRQLAGIRVAPMEGG